LISDEGLVTCERKEKTWHCATGISSAFTVPGLLFHLARVTSREHGSIQHSNFLAVTTVGSKVESENRLENSRKVSKFGDTHTSSGQLISFVLTDGDESITIVHLYEWYGDGINQISILWTYL